MKIELYSRYGCGECDNLKRILKARSIQFTEIKIDVDIELADVKTKYPQAKHLPIIVVDDNWIEHQGDLRLLLEKK